MTLSNQGRVHAPRARRARLGAATITTGAVLLGAALLGGLLLGGSVYAQPATGGGSLDGVVRTRRLATADDARFQKRINELSASNVSLVEEYLGVIEQVEALKAYNRQLARLVQSQDDEVISLDDQIERATAVSRALTPLMLEMLSKLEQFVQLDVPFLMGEREGRVAKLRATMDRSDVTESEKFRQVLEAFQIEADYGRSIEQYKGEIDFEGKKRTVDFLRVGRTALMFRTLDGELLGAWDQKSRKWMRLPDDYANSMNYGLRVARKERAADDLLTVPLPAPEKVQRVLAEAPRMRPSADDEAPTAAEDNAEAPEGADTDEGDNQ